MKMTKQIIFFGAIGKRRLSLQLCKGLLLKVYLKWSLVP